MVRTRSLVATTLVAMFVTASGAVFSPQDAAKNAPARTSSKATEKKISIDEKPYKIRAWVAISPNARVDERGRAAIIAEWKALVDRFVGVPWQLEVADGHGPMLSGRLAQLQPATVAPMTTGYDKAWLVEIEPLPNSHGFTLAGREFDQATGLLSLVFTEQARTLEESPRALFKLSLDMFSPTAEIGLQTAGGVTIHVQGSSIQASNPVGRVITPGSVFRVARVHYNADGSIHLVTQIPRTYLQVDRINGPDAWCQIISRLRDPLTRMVRGRFKVFAVGVKPTSLPTRLRFVTAPPENRPAAGYTLMARPAPNGPTHEVGTTDREGRVVLPPRFGLGLQLLKLLAAGIEPLDELPIMAGERVDELTITLPSTKPDAVTLESQLNAMHDAILDQVVTRARLEAMLKPRAEAENWDEVRLLLEEYEKLPKRTVYQEQLKVLEEEAKKKQAEIKFPVLTRSALNLLRDTGALVERYLDDDAFLAYSDAYARYAATAPPEKLKSKTLPTERPEAALSRLSVASAANVGQDEAKLGLAEYKPTGLGFRIAMPAGTPPAETTKDVTLSNGSKVIQHIHTADDPKMGRFVLTYFDYEKPPTRDSAIQRALDSTRGLFLSEGRRSRVINERPIALAGYPGREIEVEIPATEQGGFKTLSRNRAFLVGPRFYTISVTGTEAMVRARVSEIFLDSFRPIGSAATGAAAPAGTQASAGSATSNPTESTDTTRTAAKSDSTTKGPR